MDQGPLKWGKEVADKMRIGKSGEDLISFEKGESNWEQQEYFRGKTELY